MMTPGRSGPGSRLSPALAELSDSLLVLIVPALACNLLSLLLT